MGLTEVLRLVVDADTRGAVQGIEKLGSTAQRELSRSEKSIDKWGNRLTNVGAGMVGIGAAALVGLGAAAKASEEANLSVVKLENTLQNMPKLAGESSQQFIDLADSIQDVTAADADAIVEAEALLGTFQLTADEILGITPLIVDYARKFGTDIPSAAVQVGKALDGQVGALKRNGVSIDEVMFKTDRYGAVQKALTEQVGGFAEAEGATFAGSIQRMKNELGDLAEGVGVGAVDAFTSLFGVVDGITGRLNDLSPATQSAIGKIATFGAVGLIAAGGVSVLIGQAIKMRDNFMLARDAISTFAGAGGIGKLAKVSLAVGALIALREVLGSVSDDIERTNLSTLENQLLDLAESGEASGATLKRVFDDVLGEIGPGVEGFSQAAAQTRSDINSLDDALATLAGKSPEAAAKAFERISEAMQEQGFSAAEVKDRFDTYAEAVASADTTNRTADDAIEGVTSSFEEQAGATEEAKTALQEYDDTIRAMTDPLFGAMNAITGNRDAQLAYTDALAGVLEAQAAVDEAVSAHGANSDEARDATRGLEDAQRAVSDAQWGTVESAREVDSALAALTDSVEAGDTEVGAFKDTLATWVAQGYLTQAQADAAAESVDGLAGAAEAADDKRVSIPVGTPGAPESRVRLTQVRDAAHNIPNSRNIYVSTSGTRFAVGELDSVARRVNALNNARVRVSVGGGGGLVMHDGGYVPGRRGEEVAAILQAGERVMSLAEVDAMGRGAPAMSAGVSGTSVVFSGPITVVANDPQAMVDGLKRWSRSNGPLPIPVR